MVLIKLIAKALKHVMKSSSRLLLLVSRALGTSVAVAISLNAARHLFFVLVDDGDDDAGGWFGSSAGL